MTTTTTKTTTTTTSQNDYPPRNYYNDDVFYEENSGDPGTTLYSTNNDYGAANRPPPVDYNRRPFMMPNPSKFRPSNRGRYHSNSNGDYSGVDENDFSRFEPHRVEEERIFLLKSYSPGSASGCNNRFSYGPIYLEEKSDYDFKEGSEQNRPIEERFVENSATHSFIHIRLGILFIFQFYYMIYIVNAFLLFF